MGGRPRGCPLGRSPGPVPEPSPSPIPGPILRPSPGPLPRPSLRLSPEPSPTVSPGLSPRPSPGFCPRPSPGPSPGPSGRPSLSRSLGPSPGPSFPDTATLHGQKPTAFQAPRNRFPIIDSRLTITDRQRLTADGRKSGSMLPQSKTRPFVFFVFFVPRRLSSGQALC